MKFKLHKSNLLEALNAVQGVVGARVTLPVLSNVLVSAEGENLSFTTKTPMVMFWANRRCSYCEELEEAINSPEFKAWQAAHPDYVYNFVFAEAAKDLAPNVGSGAMEFAESANGTITPLKQ